MGVGLSDRRIRDAWMADGTATSLGVLANAWKETVRDAVADREAAKAEVRRMIGRRQLPEAERKRLYTLLKRDQWMGDPLLRRWMRQRWRRGHNHTGNQVIIRSDKVRGSALGRPGDGVNGLVQLHRCRLSLRSRPLHQLSGSHRQVVARSPITGPTPPYR
jgi:hypothetical protein